jgi:membrane-associated phospholipid phosphatase
MRHLKFSSAVLLVLLSTLPAVPAGAEDAPSATSPPSYLRLLGEDVVHEITAPARWDRREWEGFSLAVLGVGAAATLDRSLRDSQQRNRSSSFQNNVAKTFEPLGAGGAFVVLGGFYGLGAVRGDAKERRVAEDGLAASIVAGGLVTPVLKVIVGRSRPNQNRGTFDFHPLSTKYQSFPSGHTTEAFAVASVIATHYPSAWVEVVSYGSAALVGFARVHHDAHFLSDVVGGALIGTAVGRSVTHFNHDRRNGIPARIVVAPIVGPDRQPGIGMAMSF